MASTTGDLTLASWVRLTAHEKLVFKIPQALRCLFMEFRNGTLTFRAVFRETPTALDQELISDALCETAGSFTEITEHHLECVVSHAGFDELEKLDYWLFARADEVDQAE